MPINRKEIVNDITNQIARIGGSFSEWYVGTAKDSRGQLFQSHLVANRKDGFLYRQAFTEESRKEARDQLVKEFVLRSVTDDLSEPGRIVFAYRKPLPADAEPLCKSAAPYYRVA